MEKIKSATKVVISAEKRKRKRIISATEFKYDLDSILLQLFTAFHKAVDLYNNDIRRFNPQDRVRSFEATFFNTYMMQSLREIFGTDLKRGVYGRIYLYTHGYIILFKKLDKHNMPMNVRTEHIVKIENQQEGYLFGDEEDVEAPIVFFGYFKSRIGEIGHPKFVYIDEERVKWILEEDNVIQSQELPLFTSVQEVQHVKPKVKVKKKISEGKATI